VYRYYKATGSPNPSNAIMTRDSVADLAGVTRSFKLALITYASRVQLEMQVNVGRNRIVNATVDVEGAEWRHVAATFETTAVDGGVGSLKLYLDGVLVRTAPVPSDAAGRVGALHHVMLQ
jgi:hypothetical protein